MGTSCSGSGHKSWPSRTFSLPTFNKEDFLATIRQRLTGRRRCIAAIAGPPGAGKSTVAQTLVDSFAKGVAKVVPMDGFHYDNAVLDELGLRARKGAPETFDFAGFATILRRLRDEEPSVAIPLFDRESDLARAGMSIINSDVRVVLVEGNYLLLNREPWTALAEYFDVTAFLAVPREELKRRLLARWLDLGWAAERAEHWVETNDMPNVESVLTARREADFS